MRMCTSLAPSSKSTFTLSRNWVPRTILSSQKSRRLSWSSARLAMSFILATRLRISWLAGVKLRGQVGVYLLMARW